MGHDCHCVSVVTGDYHTSSFRTFLPHLPSPPALLTCLPHPTSSPSFHSFLTHPSIERTTQNTSFALKTSATLACQIIHQYSEDGYHELGRNGTHFSPLPRLTWQVILKRRRTAGSRRKEKRLIDTPRLGTKNSSQTMARATNM